MVFDVSIIGAGIIGTSIARELSKYRLKIALIDKEPDFSFGVTKANSAIVHAGYDDHSETLKSRLCVQGNHLFGEICREVDVDFERNGSMVVAVEENEEKVVEELYERGLKNGVPGIRILDKKEILKREPNLSKEVRCALFAPTAGITLPYELTMALGENAVQNGVEPLLETEIKEAEIKEDMISLISDKGKKIESKFVVNAAGLYSDEIARLFGIDDFYVYPKRGEYFLFDKKFRPLVNSTIFPVPTEKGKGILVTKTCEELVLIGPNSVVIEDKEKNETTNEGLNEVFEGARKLVMGMEKAKKYTIKNFAGNRPQSSKEDFVIGQKERFINVAGIQSPGLTAAPAIAEYVAETLKYSTKMEHNENFNPIRKRIAAFRTMSDAERAQAIKNDEKYGHLVCRCEHVSEAEIIEAIRRGARTVDGIKFRTRCGMGRCQSGFDLPFVLEILKRETGIDVRDIRKNSDGSEVVKAKTKEFLKEA